MVDASNDMINQLEMSVDGLLGVSGELIEAKDNKIRELEAEKDRIISEKDEVIRNLQAGAQDDEIIKALKDDITAKDKKIEELSAKAKKGERYVYSMFIVNTDPKLPTDAKDIADLTESYHSQRAAVETHRNSGEAKDKKIDELIGKLPKDKRAAEAANWHRERQKYWRNNDEFVSSASSLVPGSSASEAAHRNFVVAMMENPYSGLM